MFLSKLIKRTRQEQGIDPVYAYRRHRGWTEEDKKQARKLKAQGIPYADIAKQLGRTTHAVECYMTYLSKIDRRRITTASERQKHGDNPVSSVFRDTTKVPKRGPTHVSQSTVSTDLLQATMQENAIYVIKNDHCDQIHRTVHPVRIDIHNIKWPLRENHASEAKQCPENLRPHVNNDPAKIVWNLNGQSRSEPSLILGQQDSSSRETLEHPSPMSTPPAMALIDSVESNSYIPLQANVDNAFEDYYYYQIGMAVSCMKTGRGTPEWPLLEDHTVNAVKYTNSPKLHVDDYPKRIICNSGGNGFPTTLILTHEGVLSEETHQHPSSAPISPDMALSVEADSALYLADIVAAFYRNVDNSPLGTVIAGLSREPSELMTDIGHNKDKLVEISKEPDDDLDEFDCTLQDLICAYFM